MTTKIKDGAIPVPKEVLAKAGLRNGDELYVGVDDHGALIVERTRVFESGQAFLEHLSQEHEELAAEGRQLRVPTYERLERFLREQRRLSPEMREAFLEALQGGVMRLRGRECEPPGTCAHEPSQPTTIPPA